MNTEIPYLSEWLQLANSGNFDKAQQLYFEKLFPVVIEKFKNDNQSVLSPGGVLFSILGYSPEPIILTAKLISPKKHIIFTANDREEGREYLEQYLGTNMEIVHLNEESFSATYRALKEQLILNSSSQVTIDITGGKKSTVASAAIFGKDYRCRIVYVDFKEYLKELRKPLPGSEIFNVVYNPSENQPELFMQ